LTGIIPGNKKFIRKAATNLDRMGQIQYDEARYDGLTPLFLVFSNNTFQRLD